MIKVITQYTNDGSEPKELLMITFCMETQADRFAVCKGITSGLSTWSDKPKELHGVSTILWDAVNGK